MAFDQTTRNRLQRFVTDARTLLANEFTRQLQATYGMNPKTGEVADIRSLSGLTPSQQETAHLLRDTLAHYLANAEKGKEKARKTAAIERIVREQAFTVLNRLAALRMSEARGFLIESLAKGYDSKGFLWFHRISGASLGETGDAYRHYLFSLFDEFSLDLSVLFDRFSVQGRLFPSTPALLKLLALINAEGIAPLWAEDETIGWIYQYFNSNEERKKMREESQAPRNSRELAVRNQFFTPRYVVEFLTDNTLGRIWYEMTHGETELKQNCKYLVRRPNEFFLAQGEIAPELEDNLDLSQEDLFQQPVYIEHRTLKDPRDIRMLDPACGSMHFGLYAFDLFETIYSEAWDIETAQGTEASIREHGRKLITSEYKDKADFLIDVPRLIIENNIHGVDIDPRATQIAGLSLWLRAHNSWQQAGIKPQNRPKIQRSNIVCAEPMPGEKSLLQEFTASLKPTVLGQLVEVIFEKMELAGEAGTLLKIEQEIQNAIAEAKDMWRQQNQALSVFPDLAKIAKQRGEIDFDVSDINDEGFWEQAEQKILDALADYAQSAATDEGGQRRLFAEDAAKGFAFIDLSRKRFDVVLMNPPFGEPVDKVKAYLKSRYKNQVQDLYCLFVERAVTQNTNCSVGAITSSSFLKYNDYSAYRTFLLENECLDYLADLGWEVLDNAYVSASAYYFTYYRQRPSLFSDLRAQIEKSNLLLGDVSACFSGIKSPSLFAKYSKTFLDIASNPFCYSFSVDFFQWVKNSKKIADITNNNGIGAGPHNFFFRLHWEVNKNDKLKQARWPKLVNGGSFSPYYRSVNLLIDWRYDGEFIKEHLRKKYPYLKGNVGIKIQRENCYFKPGITYGKKTDRFNAQIMPDGCIPSFEGIGVYPINESNTWWILAYLNSRFVAYYLNLTSGLHKNSIYLDRLPVPEFSECDKEKLSCISKKISSLVSDKLSLFETDNNYIGGKIPGYISEFETIDGVLLSFYKTEYEILKLVMDSEEIINSYIPLGSSLLADMLKDQGAIIGNDENTLCKRPVINFGKAFGTSELFTDNSCSMTDASRLSS